MRSLPEQEHIPPTLAAGDTGWRWRPIDRIAGRLACGRLTVVLPGGAMRDYVGPADGPRALVHLRRWRGLWRTLIGGDTGFAEAYMAGDVDSPDLLALTDLFAKNEAALAGALSGSAWRRWVDRLGHLARANTRGGSRRNIAYHYDLGNAFYRLWLDPTMTYSAAWFEGQDRPLVEAQQDKYHRLARMADLRPGHQVLEIGCGWGGFARIAAEHYGCTVTGLTLSHEQHAYVDALGLGDRVRPLLVDYRDATGTYDRIVSIEMFEAVGEANWPTYFRRLGELLKPGGVAALQVITIDDARFDSYRRGADFIQKYIFPGGMLPSPGALRQAVADAGLRLVAEDFFADGYARTLAHWREAFERAWPDIAAQGFDERFRRMWRYYLCYCEAGFRNGAIDVGHFRIERP